MNSSSATADVVLMPLRLQPSAIAVFAEAFRAEWPAWYGPGGPGDADADLDAFANAEGALPVGVMAQGPTGQPVGVAALKAMSIPSHAHLTPWASAGWVSPACRGQGVGALLLGALMEEARRLGHAQVYCATATSASLLARQGWQCIDATVHDGHELQVFSKATDC